MFRILKISIYTSLEQAASISQDSTLKHAISSTLEGLNNKMSQIYYQISKLQHYLTYIRIQSKLLMFCDEIYRKRCLTM